tara:strand:- start:630 stop:830 length:201 start_codon:yes stop_codon:yes gene_type:complete
MPSYGINATHLNWCEVNSKNDYGWWFKRTTPYISEPHKDDRAYVSFKCKEDHARFMWYMLKQNESN